jgi:hypothetical protein
MLSTCKVDYNGLEKVSIVEEMLTFTLLGET